MCRADPNDIPAITASLADVGQKNLRAKSTVARKRRLKLWEVPDTRHCMIIGTCLSVTETRDMLLRAGGDVSHLNDYQVHTYAVQSAIDKKNPLTVRLQRHLDSRHATEIRRFNKANSKEELAEVWREAVAEGTVAGSVWAVTTHPCIDEALGFDVFGEVHMMSHLQGATGRRDNERLKFYKLKSQNLEEELTTLRVAEQRRRERDLRQITRLSAELSQERVQRAKHKPVSAADVSAEKTAKALVRQQQLAVLQSERVERLQKKLQRQQEEQEAHQEEMLQLQAANAQLEQSIENLLPCKAKSTDCEVNLRGRCILYLGGHNHLCQRFRNIVESKEGEFLHHDGGREQQLKHLQSLLQKADMVFCPTERISHNAMNKARKLCKENPEKPIVFLERPSISAFINGLNQL